MPVMHTPRSVGRRLRRAVNLMENLLWPLPEITEGEIDAETLVSLSRTHGPVILDIGCNDGAHTRWFLQVFPGARVYSFEPDPRARERFAVLVNDDRAELNDVAISDRDGTARFYASGGWPTDYDREPHPDGWDYSGSIRKPKGHLEVHPWCQFNNGFEVSTMRLDTWRPERGLDHIDFIWADVQGAESDLIRGAAETLSKTRFFYTEYNDEELYEGQVGLRRLLRMLRKIGFEVVTRYENDILLRNLHLPAL